MKRSRRKGRRRRCIQGGVGCAGVDAQGIRASEHGVGGETSCASERLICHGDGQLFSFSLMRVCDGICDFREDWMRILTSLKTRTDTIGRVFLLSQWDGRSSGGANETRNENCGDE
jgi:hypothetical protein